MDKDKYIGRLLDDRYEILEVIGTGGMAVVYKARCHRLNRLVAVKILKDDNFEDADFRRRFHGESQAVAMLSHPNIVNVYDVSTSAKADYIVMELIEGITLKQYMAKKGILNWKETLHFATQIAKALEHAHSKGIIHRDIKPHNIMVLKNGSVKVMDFGIAHQESHSDTMTREALGSVHYISPEQAKGGRTDDRSDLYSLGVVMYEMMAGRPPYDGGSPVAVAIQHINGGAVLPSVLNPNIPGGLEQIIMKAMARNAADRYPSAASMLADMDAFRKDPTILFDYSGVSPDVPLRLQKTPIVPPTGETGRNMPQLQTRGGEKKTPAANPPAKKSQPKTKEPPKKKEPPRPQKKAPEPKRGHGNAIAVIICSLVAVIALGIFTAILLGGGLTPTEKMVTVPYLVGQDFSKLQKYADLTINKEEVYDPNVPAGQIISQKPEANTQVAEGSRVVVIVSLGPVPNIVTMPDLKGKTQEAAEALLNSLSLGLQITVKEDYSDDVAVGEVIRSSPSQNAVLSHNQIVTLWISLGPKVQFRGMPNVIGKDREEAVNILNQQDMNLKVVFDEFYHPTIPAGTVTETNPGRGEKLKTGQTVILRVSLGVETRTMPNLVGMNVDNAVNLLKTLGFKTTPVIEYVEAEELRDTVLAQSLTRDENYELEVPITLQVSDGSRTPVEVTKDVFIDLRGKAQNDQCKVSVKRDGVEVYLYTVPKGTLSITLPDQVGAGTVLYTVIINDGHNEGDIWLLEESFVPADDSLQPPTNDSTEEEPPANG